MRAVVTGGAGYIGSGLVYLLRLNGWDVEAVDSRGGVGVTEARVQEFTPQLKPDVVFHLAAESNIEIVERIPTVVDDDMAAAEAVLEWGARRIVFTSSSAVYAEHSLPVTEESPVGPMSRYAVGKLACEKILDGAVILRLFNVIGDGNRSRDDERNSHLIPALRSKSFTLNGNDWDTPDGTTIRSWVDVEAVHAALLRGVRLRPDVYNVGGTILSTLSVVQLWERLHAPVKINPGPRRRGDVERILGDDSKLQALGWNRGRSIDQVISQL